MAEDHNFFYTRNNYDSVPGVHVGFQKMPDPVGQFAMELLKSSGSLLSASPDGEDSAGRSKVRGKTAQELVTFAFDIAEETYRQLKDRDLMIDLPSFEEIDERAKEQENKN